MMMRRLALWLGINVLWATSTFAAGLDRRGAMQQAKQLQDRLNRYEQTIANSPFNGPYFQQFQMVNGMARQDDQTLLQAFSQQDSDVALRERVNTLMSTGSWARWQQHFAQGEPSFNQEANNSNNPPPVLARWRALLLEGQGIRMQLQSLQSTLSAWGCN